MILCIFVNVCSFIKGYEIKTGLETLDVNGYQKLAGKEKGKKRKIERGEELSVSKIRDPLKRTTY